MGADLFIPVAVAEDGRIVHAHEGSRGRSFRCPGCASPVTWRKCDEVKRRSHFAHQPDAVCSESVVHSSAKMIVAQHLNDWADGVSRVPGLSLTCKECGDALPPHGFGRPGRATVETSLSSGLRPDVWIAGTRTAVEICHTHPIGDEKIASFATDQIQWIELQADLLLEDPAIWRVLRWSGSDVVCWGCVRGIDGVGLVRRSQALDAREARLAEQTANLEPRVLLLMEEYERLARQAATARAEVEESCARKLQALGELEAVSKDLAARRSELGFERSKIVQFLGTDAHLQKIRLQVDQASKELAHLTQKAEDLRGP